MNTLFFALALVSHAPASAAPREELSALVVQYQKTPTQDLREKIMSKAASPKARPALPEEAEKQLFMAATYQKEAKDATGLGLALTAYEKALELAPWWPDARYNYSVALESAKRYEDAERELRLYLLSKPADAAKAKTRLYSLEAKKNLAAAAAAVPTFAGRWSPASLMHLENGLRNITKEGDGWKVLDLGLRPMNVVSSDARRIEIETTDSKSTDHETLTLSEDGSRIDMVYYTTQSAAQFEAMQAAMPGGRFTDLDNRHHSTLTRK